MIDEQILKNAIKEYFKDFISDGHEHVEITEANADVQKIIDRLSEDGCWCPIEEGNPSDDRYVLLSFENFSLPQVGRYEEDAEGGGSYYLGDEDVPLTQYGVFVNAWMELPKQYRETKEVQSCH